jgi:Na+-transporting methylmalonyl-CoA/oxaloacetate decarboxylase gamma subunit
VDNPLIVALAITVAGMGLLFLALGFFYGLLSLISSVVRDGPQPAPAAEAADQAAASGGGAPAGAELVHRAAAIAVALARAESDGRPAPAPAGPVDEPLSPWSILHQGRRVSRGSSPWRSS